MAVERTNVSEERGASIIMVTRIGELGTRLLLTANVILSSPILVTLMMEALRSSEMLVFIRSTRRKIPEDSILQASIQD
jgi:hypothetical protein